ncbi:MAG TPA: FAD-dependent oxidoreductase [Actinomycetota bacterium]|nr:FAD-dependent oxidoreductase [Actinomycetota bacterium]
MNDVQAVVVGGGIAGAAAARDLARSGVEVLLLEQFRLGHKRGSSHGSSRIFRFSYSDPHLVQDCMDSLPLWRDLEEEMGVVLYTRTGGFDVGDVALDHKSALEKCGAECELLDAGEAERRYPGLRFPRDAPSLFQPDAGISHADAAVRAYVDSARMHGATVREGVRVERIEPTERAVTLHIPGSRVSAQTVVVTAGAWAASLLAGCGIELAVTATRETVVYFPFEDGLVIPSVVEWEASPPFFSLLAPGVGLKAGWHHAGPVITDPDRSGKPSKKTIEAVTGWVRERFPEAQPEPAAAETCLYTTTPDEQFVLTRHGRVVVGSVCSGHGFKFGPLTGRRLAALAWEVL